MLMTKHVVLVLVNHRLTVFDQNNMRLFKSTKCSKYQPYVFNPYAFNPYVLNPTIKFQCCSRKFLILLFTCSAVFFFECEEKLSFLVKKYFTASYSIGISRKRVSNIAKFRYIFTFFILK